MNFLKNKRFKQGSLFLVTFTLIGMISFMFAKAGVYKPNLTITYDSTIISGAPTINQDIKGLVNQEIEIKYKVTPEDLALGDINTKVSKEIVLVLDTSGSMKNPISDTDKTIRIDALRVAANNFVKKFQDVDNVKIGIADYSSKANDNGLSLPLTSTKSGISNLVTQINKYTVNNIGGGTNTGDGIRYALNMLNDGTVAKKFVVLMSDGEPTFYMKKAVYTQKQVWNEGYYTGYWWNRVWHEGYYTTVTETSYEYYTDLDNNNAPILEGPGNEDDSEQNCLKYASTMAAKIKEANYSSFNIAYSAGGSAEKMKTLATSAGGKYFSALDANAINNVFSEIADQIKGSYAVSGVNLKYSLPTGIEYAGQMADVTIDGTTYTQQIPDLIYRLNSTNSKYITDPFYISFKFKATKSGTYSLPQDATLNYKGLDGNLISIKLNQAINYIANDLVAEGTPVINANLEGQSPDLGGIEEDLILKCKINPEIFNVFETTNGVKAPSYSFKVKLKFNLQEKFESVLGIDKSTDPNFDVETPEFDVIYKLDTMGNYVPEPMDYKYLTVKVKDGVDVDNLQFGPGVVSYIDLNNKLASRNIEPFSIKMKQPPKLGEFGLYKGIDKNLPSILESYSPFNIEEGTNIILGATLTGSISNNSKVRLDIQTGLSLNGEIEVYSYDDMGGRTLYGKMERVDSADTSKVTYKYSGKEIINEKILILYNESLKDITNLNSVFTNRLYIGDSIKTVEIKVNDGIVELF